MRRRHPEWELPDDAGENNDAPESTQFFNKADYSWLGTAISYSSMVMKSLLKPTKLFSTIKSS